MAAQQGNQAGTWPQEKQAMQQGNQPGTLQQEDLDAQYATTLLKAGTEAPAFTLRDIKGREVSLSQFRGRNVVLVFWASWCPDCRAEVPALKALHAKADPEKTAFVSVSFDRSFETLCQFVEENYLPGVQLFDPAGKKESQVAEQYGVKWIPSLYLIGPDGKVVLGTVVLEKLAAALVAAGAAPESALAAVRSQSASQSAAPTQPAPQSQKPGQQLCTDESCAAPQPQQPAQQLCTDENCAQPQQPARQQPRPQK